MTSGAKGSPTNCSPDLYHLGSLWGSWECWWRSSSLTPSGTQGSCTACLCNANPVWQPHKQLWSISHPQFNPCPLPNCFTVTNAAGGGLHTDITPSPPPAAAMPRTWLLKQQNSMWSGEKGCPAPARQRPPPLPSLCHREWRTRLELRQGSARNMPPLPPLASKASGPSVSWWNFLLRRAGDSDVQGWSPWARKVHNGPQRAQLYKWTHWPGDVGIYARASAGSGSNQTRIQTKTNNHSPTWYFG